MSDASAHSGPTDGQARPSESTNTFGLKKAGGKTNHNSARRIYAPNPTHDYTYKYSPDKLFHELDENSRFWSVYNDEANVFDNDMVGEASDSLDILLIFAGLFSSVSAQLVLGTATSLQQDPSSVSVLLLQELISLQRAQASGLPASSVPSTDTVFSASQLDLWVNGLWFFSLVLSLSSTLLAALAKQWLRQYRAMVTGNSRERALTRQFRFDGLQKWKVPLIVSLLPTLLHVSLLLFLIGLVLFLLPLNLAISIVVGLITVLLVLAYITTNILPLKYLQCPYRTPLTEVLYRLIKKREFKRREDDFTSCWSIFGTAIPEAIDWLARSTSNSSALKIVHEAMTSLSPKWMIPFQIWGNYPSTAWIERFSTDGRFWAFLEWTWRYEPEVEGLADHEQGEGGSGCMVLSHFSQEDKETIQRKLIGSIYARAVHDLPINREGMGWTLHGIPPDRQTREYKVMPTDFGLALVLLAGGNSVTFESLKDSPLSNVRLESVEAFPWIVNHYESIPLPDLPHIVWMALRKEAQWEFPPIGEWLEQGSGFNKVIEECQGMSVAMPTLASHGTISLAQYLLQEQNDLEFELRYQQEKSGMREGSGDRVEEIKMEV